MAKRAESGKRKAGGADSVWRASTKRRYWPIATSASAVLNRPRVSPTQATLSTCNGCSANNSAPAQAAIGMLHQSNQQIENQQHAQRVQHQIADVEYARVERSVRSAERAGQERLSRVKRVADRDVQVFVRAMTQKCPTFDQLTGSRNGFLVRWMSSSQVKNWKWTTCPKTSRTTTSSAKR